MNRNSLHIPKILFIFTIFIFCFYSCSSEENDLEVKNTDLSNENSDPTSNEIISYLPSGYVKDGSVDYTKYLQDAIMENSIFTFPNFPIMINRRGLHLQSNSKVYFQPKSKLILLKSDAGSYKLLSIAGKENVEVHNAYLIAERVEVVNGVPRDGEWGMGISIKSSKNVKLINPYTTDTWGDGIYLGKSESYNNATNENITITNPVITNSGRNGISITTGKNIFITGGEISHTYGKSPEAAIDIEPNGSSDTIENVNIVDLSTRENKNGLLISLRQLVSMEPKTVSINIINHTDYKTIQAFRFAGLNRTLDPSFVPLNGQILIKNSTWEDVRGAFTWEDTYNLFPPTTIEEITLIKNKDGNKLVDSVTYITKLKSWLKNSEPNFTIIP